MSVNGITSTQAAAAYSYSSTSAAKEKTSAEEVKSTKTAEDTGVIYEHNTDTKTSSTKKTYKPDTALINKLKADADARTSQLRSLVEQMMGKQADAYGNAMISGPSYVPVLYRRSRHQSAGTGRHCRRRLLGCEPDLRPYHPVRHCSDRRRSRQDRIHARGIQEGLRTGGKDLGRFSPRDLPEDLRCRYGKVR